MRAPRVLVVDDEPALRELLAMVCAYEGWQVETAAAGGPAIRWARAHDPDVVLLDMMLPDMDGLEVLARLLEHDRRLPVVVVSARDAAESRAAALAAGAAAYVTKPFGVAEVTAQVRRVLELPAPAATGGLRG